MLYMMFRTLS